MQSQIWHIKHFKSSRLQNVPGKILLVSFSLRPTSVTLCHYLYCSDLQDVFNVSHTFTWDLRFGQEKFRGVCGIVSML